MEIQTLISIADGSIYMCPGDDYPDPLKKSGKVVISNHTLLLDFQILHKGDKMGEQEGDGDSHPDPRKVLMKL